LRARLASYDNSAFVQAALAARAQLDRLPDWLYAPLKRLVNAARTMRATRRGA
jgi:hypothetical protein